ncbi:uncharacterized protein LOC109863988 [Pseudomyrmex gracilis]|uniref:uncharacterized protein LOC109863988 n=1 Tax=Pseudomyrmex gracilis TaxID=219809 RepID=UPI00099575B3|nr:uncharacterized protein LOC109863988 [Pseudomyrmex gracilis]
MKLTLFTLLALCIIAVCKSAEEEYDYEEEAAAAPPVTPAPAKPAGGRLGGLLSPRGRTNVAAANVGKKRAPATQSTTSKPVEQAPEEDADAEDEEVLEESQEHDAPTTTTESTKKLRSNGGVRPFRSNEDLLNALKRRRAQIGSSSHSRESASTHSAAEHTTPKSKVTTTNNRSKPSTGGEARPSGRGRFGGKGSKTVQEEVEETQREEIQVKPKVSPRRG